MRSKKKTFQFLPDLVFGTAILSLFIGFELYFMPKLGPQAPTKTVEVFHDFLADCENPCQKKGAKNHVMMENAKARILCDCLETEE